MLTVMARLARVERFADPVSPVAISFTSPVSAGGSVGPRSMVGSSACRAIRGVPRTAVSKVVRIMNFIVELGCWFGRADCVEVVGVMGESLGTG